MSETKKAKAASTETKKKSPGKAEAGKKEADKAPKSNESGTKEAAKEKPKSASQTSISHFSSVATPEYRAGWDSIFGQSKSSKKKGKKSSAADLLPEQLVIEDDEIDEEFRAVLYKLFQRQARKQGLSLAKSKSRIELSYCLQCNISSK
ncbi:MAG: hypothetical protein ABJH63_01590 [Rhizobiaceae bacterium]